MAPILLWQMARHAGATAIHPGYGFFAEDFRFARRVAERSRGLIFIGPSWRIIRSLGDKINTKRLARSLSIPTVPGSDRPVYDELEAEEIAETLFAFQAEQGISDSVVLVKASAGGGGMEVNTRIQVENGVSAAISRIKGRGDVNLIAEQIRLGLGEPMELFIVSRMKREKPLVYDGPEGIIYAVYFQHDQNVDQGAPLVGVCQESQTGLIEDVVNRVRTSWEEGE